MKYNYLLAEVWKSISSAAVFPLFLYCKLVGNNTIMQDILPYETSNIVKLS